MKLLILILAMNDPSVIYTMKNGIEKTWNSINISNVQTYYYFGGHREQSHQDGIIKLVTDESLMSVGPRTFECYDYCIKNFEFDYIFRTNISSYVHKQNLYNFLLDKPRSNFYSAVKKFDRGVHYADGCGYTISKDIAQYLVQNKEHIDLSYIDDAATGKMLSHVDIFPAPRVDLLCDYTSSDYDKSNFHYRCKCSGDRRVDSVVMESIHRNYYGMNK